MDTLSLYLNKYKKREKVDMFWIFLICASLMVKLLLFLRIRIRPRSPIIWIVIVLFIWTHTLHSICILEGEIKFYLLLCTYIYISLLILRLGHSIKEFDGHNNKETWIKLKEKGWKISWSLVSILKFANRLSLASSWPWRSYCHA